MPKIGLKYLYNYKLLDGKGFLDLNDYLSACKAVENNKPNPKELIDALAMFETEPNSGKISVKGLNEMLKTIGDIITEGEVVY